MKIGSCLGADGNLENHTALMGPDPSAFDLFWSPLNNSPAKSIVYSYLTQIFIRSIFIIILWIQAPRLGQLVAGSADDQSLVISDQGSENICRAIFCIAGFNALLYIIKPAVQFLFYLPLLSGRKLSGYDVSNLVEIAIYLALALILIFTPKGIWKLIRYARTAG